MKKTISVIVPVYNVAAYLEKCVTSILNQTYGDIEIIIVDDGSTDGSGELCDSLQKLDERIKVIHKANGGISDARNAGMAIAQGEYFSFVDSDDSIEPDMLELLFSNLTKYEADISCCRYSRVWENGESRPVGDTHEISVFTGTDAFGEYLYGRVIDPFACAKLYKREVLINADGSLLTFKVGILGEDNPFNCDVMQRASRVVLVGEAKYNYLQKREGAITNSAVSQKKIDSVYWWDTIRLYCKANYPQLEKYALRRQMLFYIGLYNRIYTDKQYKKDKEYIKSFVKSHSKEVAKSDICEKTVKSAVFLLAHFPWMYNAMMKLYKSVKGEADL